MLNSDDCYMPGAFQYIFTETPYYQYDFLHGNCFAGKQIASAEEFRHPPEQKATLFKLLLFFYDLSHIIPSQSVFIRKDIVGRVGLLNEDLHYCMDLDYYCRIALTTTKRFFYNKTICFYRVNEFTKTGGDLDKGIIEAISIAKTYQNNISPKERKELHKFFAIFEGLQKVWSNKEKANLPYLFKVFTKAPNIAVKDKLFVHLAKKALVTPIKQSLNLLTAWIKQ